jgi:hypothetical protein
MTIGAGAPVINKKQPLNIEALVLLAFGFMLTPSRTSHGCLDGKPQCPQGGLIPADAASSGMKKENSFLPVPPQRRYFYSERYRKIHGEPWPMAAPLV